MKIRILLFICLFLIVLITNGQIYGFKFGWSQPDYNLNKNNFIKYNENLYQGYQYGAFIRTDSSRFFFQIEAFYMKSEETFFNEPGKPNFNPAIDTFNQHVVLQTINIPFSVGLRLIRLSHFDVRAHAAIQSSVTLDKKITSSLNTSPINSNLIENIVVKYFVGAGFDLYFLSCDLRYYFENTSPIKSTETISFPYKDRYFNFSAALKF
ncbi:MAG: hypothetical protein WCL51_05135 [Bacteroidota bacterium]